MKELLLKYINGDCTDQEKVEITNWLDSDPQNMNEYDTLRRLNDISVWQISSTSRFSQEKKAKTSGFSKKLYREVLKIAAVFIFSLLIIKFFPSEFISKSPTVKMQTVHVPAGQRAEITLQDGTKVWLNAKTTLIFPSQFSGKSRKVKLDGEGFFEVSQDKAKPFIVGTRKYDVQVWGTKFNLIAYSANGNFKTSLLEGAVEVMKQGSKKGIMLKPNEQAALKDDRMVISSIRNMDHFLWREGIISFDNSTFTELIDKLELYFDLKIEVKSPQILNYRYTGKFRMKDGVEHILKVLQLKNKFEYKTDEKQNKITIE